MKFGFGVDLGGTTVKLAYFDEAGTMLDKWEIPTNTAENGKYILPDIAAAVIKYMEEKKISREDIIGVGIGVPGAVNNKGIVAGCDNLGWGHFSVKDALEPLLDMPVVAGNDATVAALGECWKGGGQGYKSVVLVTLGTGVGGGIIIDGKPVHGFSGAAGEIGHIIIHPDGLTCPCGQRGCFEQYASTLALMHQTEQAIVAHPDSLLARLAQTEGVSYPLPFLATEQGCPVAAALIDRFCRDLAIGIDSLVHVLDPRHVVLAGAITSQGDLLLDPLLSHLHTDIPVTLAAHYEHAGVIGAARLFKGKDV